MKHPTIIEGVNFRIRTHNIIRIRSRCGRICATKSADIRIVSLNSVKQLIIGLLLNIASAIHSPRNGWRNILKISVSTNRHKTMPIKDGDIFTLRLGKGSRKTFQIEVAVSPAAIVQGLSGRPNLEEGAGMLFIFSGVSRQSMWMIDMKFHLDIVWLDESFIVVHITYNTPPCANAQNCPSYSSVRRVKYAIEMTAGAAEAYGFKRELQLMVL